MPAGHNVAFARGAAQHVAIDVPADETDAVLVEAIPDRRILVLQVAGWVGDAETTVRFGSLGQADSTDISPLITHDVLAGEVLGYSPVGWFKTRPGEALVATVSDGADAGLLLAYVPV